MEKLLKEHDAGCWAFTCPWQAALFLRVLPRPQGLHHLAVVILWVAGNLPIVVADRARVAAFDEEAMEGSYVELALPEDLYYVAPVAGTGGVVA
ncbi:hypothetical protein QEH56_07555 [Pelagicoccus enzymogenes]|uniref:hypothetical protein n=1 Tax=Pelagicoccus enzymogenes TaxID=2773457 RepID=UPI00280FB354|nr:hypothetical protein [Pelagicoccus enzymogenes]MDQ8197998.1 hypothetical protein [Pelagicoccus enzymogenes]